ncbi:MAG: hypothetical protein A2831_00635 [Candidatus Yanofskybacteria bacterium RIFCSPHIGHO2_01_FULL_44_17]|uniref:3-deoxy-D-manno-octulosonate 8-phosphate phosphatase n=1 Tax=Candidatus Yanofskybacteria bacterium RIFCSPHIGHO2_01_FULL_44_17 TaxID=1802668 RepID=A0A1F8EXT5_9BACT|nr:MAG: hypothetical protein A2831_00635 [Candidatus Yanofskybacteria bacterium RIFCSPHIGHO2_01_FULL_44_17]
MQKLSFKVSEKLKYIRLIAFDFDGVFTNGLFMLSQDGTESIICNRRDSWGLNEMKRLGIKMVVINKGLDPAVSKRCQKLKLEYKYDATKDKLSILKDVLVREQVKPESVLYVGDDTIDLPCLKYAGLAVTVADGASECKKAADYITEKNGGQGAVRELCELIVVAKGGLSRT